MGTEGKRDFEPVPNRGMLGERVRMMHERDGENGVGVREGRRGGGRKLV